MTTCQGCGKTFRNLNWHLKGPCGKTGGESSPPSPPAAAYEERQLPPGTIFRPYSPDPNKVLPPQKAGGWAKLAQEIGMVHLTNPPESCPVTWQGVTVYIRGGVDTDVPAPHAAIYNDYLRSRNLPVVRPRGVTVEERANQPSHQGFGILESVPEEA